MNSHLKQSVIAEGRDWYHDRISAIQVERNRYFMAFIISLLVLALAIIGFILFLPLKTVVPYVIEIDKSTGITTILKPADAKNLRGNQSITTYFLLQFLNARMNYDFGLRQLNANKVRNLSTAAVYSTYAAQMDVHNPDSPIRTLGGNASIRLHINSYSYPYPNIAEIHLYTEIINTDETNATPQRHYWVATIKYIYADNSLPSEVRETTNPLGFFVTDFQLNQETP